MGIRANSRERERESHQHYQWRRLSQNGSSIPSATLSPLTTGKPSPIASKYGLRYDDLYDPLFDLDIKEALNRLPREVVDARNQRLKRALDLSMKHDYLTPEMQALQTPFRSYLQEMLELVKREQAERQSLGALPL